MNLTTKLGHSRDRKGSAGRKKCSHCVQWRLAWTPGWVVMPFPGFILVLLLDAGDLGETTIRVTITWTLVKIAFCWHVAAAAAAKSLQLCPTLCDPIDGSPPGPHPWDSPGKNTGVGCPFLLQCVKVKSESEVAQLCLTLSNPIDCSPPGSSVHGIFQARVLEWGAIAFSVLACFSHF